MSSSIYGSLMLCLAVILAVAVMVVLALWLAWGRHYIWAPLCAAGAVACAGYGIRLLRGQ